MISIRIDGGEGHYTRELVIQRLDSPSKKLKWEEKGWYRVKLYVVSTEAFGREFKQHIRSATFQHAYGDDVLTLTSEAIDALGGLGGPRTGLLR